MWQREFIALKAYIYKEKYFQAARQAFTLGNNEESNLRVKQTAQKIYWINLWNCKQESNRKKTNKTRRWIFEKINKIDKTLDKPTKNKEGEEEMLTILNWKRMIIS